MRAGHGAARAGTGEPEGRGSRLPRSLFPFAGGRERREVAAPLPFWAVLCFWLLLPCSCCTSSLPRLVAAPFQVFFTNTLAKRSPKRVAGWHSVPEC